MSKANDYATALGMKVKRVVNLSEPGTQSASSYDRVIVTGSRIDGGATTPIEVGEITVNLFVDITVELTK